MNIPPSGAGQVAGTPAPIPSSELLRGQRVIEIDHEGQRYRLQATRQGKLILTK
ncbi:hemin uptake protein HemP [Hydrogenophaga atypica]|uniref:Hemin uptake protein HemP n=1 Tax=Hydrogenophaga atypica TaxID=249409 RepID=A0ABW2QLU6_9BURK